MNQKCVTGRPAGGGKRIRVNVVKNLRTHHERLALAATLKTKQPRARLSSDSNISDGISAAAREVTCVAPLPGAVLSPVVRSAHHCGHVPEVVQGGLGSVPYRTAQSADSACAATPGAGGAVVTGSRHAPQQACWCSDFVPVRPDRARRRSRSGRVADGAEITLTWKRVCQRSL
jgi:hypothetical protein